jgi:CRISPR-associated protein Cmr2
MPSTQYLFLFTIGSPQAFIAQARKTHDLYAGSALISDLIYVAMQESAKYGEIIFPFSGSESIPNRFLAKVSSADVQQLGADIEKVTRACWYRLSIEALNQAAQLNGTLENFTADDLAKLSAEGCLRIIASTSSIAARQIAEFPDIFWAAISYENNNDYKAGYEKLNRLLGGGKSVRKFCQLSEPAGRKCSLDGERNAIFYRADENGKAPAFMSWDEKEYSDQIHKITNQKVAYALTPKEALSAVSLVKRFYRYQGREAFPSTAQIALMNIPKERIEKVYKKYLHGEEVDYQLFYDENLTEKNLCNQDIKIRNGHNLEDIRKAFNNIFDDIPKQKRAKYYAIIVFDGDNFGKLWSGEGLKDEKQLERFQIELARYLHTFAREAKKILSYPKGKTVYAGGDDFLGFVNLNHLFKVMSELRIAYTNLIETPIIKEFNNSFTRSITFTAGVAIAHYREPLSVVLGEARAAEKAAKKAFENDDKDAFSLSVLKHSGLSLRCFYKWKYNGLQLTDALGTVVTKLQSADNGFSNTFIKNIDQEFRPLMNDKGEYSGGTMRVLSELNRLITRSSQFGKDNPEIGGLQECIKHIYDSNCRYNKSLENFLVSLHICDFIKRKTSDD